MKIVQINATCGAGSTGKICSAVAELLDREQIENYIFYSSGYSTDPHGRKYMSKMDEKIQALCSRMFGNYGFNTYFATKRLLKELDNISPDIVHLHNLHGHNVNLALLFNYFKAHRNIKLYWTFHDCWAFTGYCPHFTMAKCDKWRSGCEHCPQRKEYSWFFDCSKKVYNKKKELFSGLDMTVITPSKWLGDLVKESFLKSCTVKVINNGIDLSVFKPTESDFRKNNGITEKYMVLAVAYGWGEKKGLDAVIELSKLLGSDYRMVLVGTNATVDALLPDNIISIHRTQDQKQLAEIYTAADVFANPTREEVLGLVNIEALACATPVVTFDTGGSAETLDETCGRVVACNDVTGMKAQIEEICEKGILKEKDCLKRATSYAKDTSYKRYVEEYKI